MDDVGIFICFLLLIVAYEKALFPQLVSLYIDYCCVRYISCGQETLHEA